MLFDLFSALSDRDYVIKGSLGVVPGEPFCYLAFIQAAESKVMAEKMPEWLWNGKLERWMFAFEQVRRYDPSVWKWRPWKPKYFVNTIEVLVARSLDGRDAQLRACASAYAARLDFLEEAIAIYLNGRVVKVYGGYKDPEQYSEVVHPKKPAVDIRTIELPDAQHPRRVHVFVDTCYPDPYFLYEIIFEDMAIVDARCEVE